MHIMLLTQFYAPEFGAAAVRLERLARLLAADGHDVTVLTGMPNYPAGVIPPEYRGKLFVSETRDGVQIRRVWVYASPSKRARARLLNWVSLMLMTALRGIGLPRPDVLLVESHPLTVCVSGGWLKRIKRAPVVLNVSDLWPESAIAVGAMRADSRFVKLAEKLESWAYRDAAHIIGMTRGVYNGILARLPQPEKVTLLLNAVDLGRFRPGLDSERAAIRQRYQLDGALVAAHVGNISLMYDFECMLDVAAALPEVKFLFAGGGTQAPFIEEQVTARGLSNVVLTGVLPHDDMPAVWAGIDVLLLSLKAHPLFEGQLPAKMFEAMATGTPVVAAARGEARDLLTQTGAGIVVPIGDRQGMIDALRQLANTPERLQAMGTAGRAYAEAHLAPERVKAAFVEIFERVTGSGKTP